VGRLRLNTNPVGEEILCNNGQLGTRRRGSNELRPESPKLGAQLPNKLAPQDQVAPHSTALLHTVSAAGCFRGQLLDHKAHHESLNGRELVFVKRAQRVFVGRQLFESLHDLREKILSERAQRVKDRAQEKQAGLLTANSSVNCSWRGGALLCQYGNVDRPLVDSRETRERWRHLLDKIVDKCIKGSGRITRKKSGHLVQ
jgi:hypothetical protein